MIFLDKNTVKPLDELLDSVRDIEGFPKGKDEDILSLSDPPFYTACPNPYIKKFIEKYAKIYDNAEDDYKREPFFEDVSQGKNHPIYNAFSYHTKVPHQAIMKFIEHYTNPGDIVFDGFCGTGMTGIAAQMTNRKGIILELSPAATFLSYNYNLVRNVDEFENSVKSIIHEVKKECSWMYETEHISKINNEIIGIGMINHTVWSDVFICPFCKKEFVLFDTAVNKNTKKVAKNFNCPHCNAELSKNDCEYATSKYFDSAINQEVEMKKQLPVLINYNFNGKRYEKKPDKNDFQKIKKIEDMEIPYFYPTNPMMNSGERWGDTWRAGVHLGITHVHHFFTKRNLWVLSSIFNKIQKKRNLIVLLILLTNNSKMSRYGARTGNVSGTLYVPSLMKELNVIEYLHRKLYGPKGIIKPIKELSKKLNQKCIISTNSVTDLSNIPDSCVDYIFTDPPFGSNLMYSELNFIWESWLNVFTNIEKEAIENNSQTKSLEEYKDLMTHGFKENYRILKPNRWMTVEFHNSKASVWNAIQESISKAGFIIAQVAVLDKKQGSFKQVTAPGAVKNDLIINAYKPKKDFEIKFLKKSGEGMEVDFITQQLMVLPIRQNIERTEKMLYSKMLAHYVENGFKIKYNSTNFYKLLSDNFVELDGYWFLEEQVKEYNKWKSGLSLDELKKSMSSQQSLFVSDEKTALTWLYHFLNEPKSYSDIFTAYQQVATTSDDAIPEIRELLDNNFILENGLYRRPLNKDEKEELNRNRDKELDRAFNKLLTRAKEQKGKIKEVRKEALIHGFTKCYQKGQYHDILTIADKLYTGTLESSGEIMDFVDIARIKTKGKKNIEDF